MPIIVKPLSPGVPGDPADNRTDGFDPLWPAQMIPLGRTREMVVQTGDFKAEMRLRAPDISSMSNFRILSQTVTSTFPLPGPGVLVRRIALPERSVVQFTLHGRTLGNTVLVGQDRPAGREPLLSGIALLISVKPAVARQVAVCYAFDRINRDNGVRGDFSTHLSEVHKIYHDQANISIINIDGATASTRAARTITLPTGTMGKVLNLLDRKLIGRLMLEFDKKFPGIVDRVQSVVMPIPVPLRIKTLPKIRIAGISQQFQRQSTGRKYSMLLIGPHSLRPKPGLSGGPTPTPARQLQHTIAHELGHSMGLRHHPKEEKDLPKLKLGRGASEELNPVFFQPDFRNLMFFAGAIQSNRINIVQIDKCHENLPEFHIVDF